MKLAALALLSVLSVAGQEKEAALGKQMAAELAPYAVKSEAVQSYVTQLGMKLAVQLSPSPFPYTFSVIDTGILRAIGVAPGGYVFVPLEVLRNAGAETWVPRTQGDCSRGITCGSIRTSKSRLTVWQLRQLRRLRLSKLHRG
jgi:hypothetical protein